MSTATTRPVALRMTDAERERLLQHGGTARAAVTKLLELADEHKTCPPPRRTGSTRAERAASTVQQGAATTQQGDVGLSDAVKQHEVQVAGRTVFRTPSKQLADRRAAREQVRHPRLKVEVR